MLLSQVVDSCGLTEGHRSSDDPNKRDVLGGTDLGPWDVHWDLGMGYFESQIMVDVWLMSLSLEALVNLSGLYKQKSGPSGGFKHVCETYT
jgi:hypothetical protein